MRQHVDEAGRDGSAARVNLGTAMPGRVRADKCNAVAIDRNVALVGGAPEPS